MEASNQRITLELHGSRTVRGVALDGLEGFIDQFRRALREFERTASAREHEIGRTGSPGSRTKAATGFRLVNFRVENPGVAELEPLELTDAEDQLVATEPASSQNLRQLLEAVSAERALSPRVIEALDGARKHLGHDGRFGFVFGPPKTSPFYVDGARIARLQAAATLDTESKEIRVTGRLHLVGVEEPGKVEVRASDGVNWTCTYDPALKETVKRHLDSVVIARGVGRRTAYNRGSMELRGVEPLPKFEQTLLFTTHAVPTAELEEQQGITRPQGLAALQDPNWVDDEASREYLAMVFDEP